MVKTSKIALGFRDYYADLYSFGSNLSPDTQATKTTAIHDYLAAAGLCPLIDEQRSTLESPITSIEIKSTGKSFPSGKSPGPMWIVKF